MGTETDPFEMTEADTFTMTDCVFWGNFNIRLAKNKLVENDDLKLLRAAGYDVVRIAGQTMKEDGK
jgi:hypothetical protein